MITKEIYIKTEHIKLDQLLKFSGIAQTGGHAKQLILNNQVLVNNNVCNQRGKKICPDDTIIVDNITFLIKKKI